MKRPVRRRRWPLPVILFLFIVLVSLAPLLRRKENQGESYIQGDHQFSSAQKAILTPLYGYSEHGLPFLIYHAFCAEREKCQVARFVAQMEGDCEAKREVFERAQIDDWLEWRADEEKKFPKCRGCSSSHTISRIKQSLRNATKAVLIERLPKNKLEIFCGFAYDKDIVVTPAKPLNQKQWLRHRSTLVFECSIPPGLRRAALNGNLRVRLAPSRRLDDDAAYPWLPLILQPNIQQRKKKNMIGACAWVRGGVYSDRAGKSQPLPAARVAEWVAHHALIGIDHFFIFDNSDNVFADIYKDNTKKMSTVSPLWLALEPYLKTGMATLAPWPSLTESTPLCDAHELEERVFRASGPSNKTTQSFFGRPAQYAAQNACHRRLIAAGISRVLHVDVDEFVVPASGKSLDEVSKSILPLSSEEQQNNYIVAAIAMPCVFYGRCDGSALGSSGGLLLDDTDCAGKAVLFRQKLIAGPSVQYLWVHYVRATDSDQALVQKLAGHHAVLVHARFGYALSDAASARAVDARLPSPQENQLYEARMWPRFSEQSTMNCSIHAQQAEQRLQTAAPDPLGSLGCDQHPGANKMEPWGWCYCPDDRPKLLSAQAIRAELLRTYGQRRLEELRALAGPLVGPSWPFPSSSSF